ncbi:hypothetical protein WJX74_007733 [Apatococcus lobatus]|uniref:Uncharacterized protein n=1 Tax=Apatococcus lobatus TaxID=904363 RepID=A0AAW1RU99_9CHLO
MKTLKRSCQTVRKWGQGILSPKTQDTHDTTIASSAETYREQGVIRACPAPAVRHRAPQLESADASGPGSTSGASTEQAAATCLSKGTLEHLTDQHSNTGCPITRQPVSKNDRAMYAQPRGSSDHGQHPSRQCTDKPNAEQENLKTTAGAVARAAAARREASMREAALQRERDTAVIKEVEAEDAEMLAALQDLASDNNFAEPESIIDSTKLSSSTGSAAGPPAAPMPFAWFVADMLKLMDGASAFKAAAWSDTVLDQLLAVMPDGSGSSEGKYVHLSGSRPLSNSSAVLASAVMMELHATSALEQDGLVTYLRGHKSALEVATSIIQKLPQGGKRSELAAVLAPLLLAVAAEPPVSSAGSPRGASQSGSRAADKSLDPECRRKEACKQIVALFGDDPGSLEKCINAHCLAHSFCGLRWKSPQLLMLKKRLESQLAAQADQKRHSTSKRHNNQICPLSKGTSQSLSRAAAPDERLVPVLQGHQLNSQARQNPSEPPRAVVHENNDDTCQRSEGGSHAALMQKQGQGLSAGTGCSSEHEAEAGESHFGGWQVIVPGRGKKHGAPSASKDLQQVFLPPYVSLDVRTAKEDVDQSFVALDNVLQHLQKGLHGSNCTDQEFWVLARVDELAKASFKIMEYWGPPLQKRLGPAWLTCVQQILGQAQVLFPTFNWPAFESARGGLRHAIMMFIQNERQQENLLWSVNSMQSQSAACGSHPAGWHCNGSQLFQQPNGIRQRRKCNS